MKITKIKIEKVPVAFERPLVVAFGTFEKAVNWFVKLETDEGLYGIGAASPFAPVTGETAESCYEILKLFSKKLVGYDTKDIGGVHNFLDSMIYANGSAKCAIDIALYDLKGKAKGLPVFRMLGGENGTVVNDVTVGIDEPDDMARLAEHYVKDMGFSILKVKIGSDFSHDLEALSKIRKSVGQNVNIRVDANQGYNLETALMVLPEFEKLGISAMEQPLPFWDFEGHGEIRRRNTTSVQIMMDESIHSPHDAARAAALHSADVMNIKLMKCGGLYYGLQIADIAQSVGAKCMVGCMCETKVSLAAGLSLVAAHSAVTEGDCDSFLLYQGGDDGIEGGFTREGGTFKLSEQSGFGFSIDF